MRKLVTVFSGVLIAILFTLPIGLNGEHYEEENVRVYSRELYILELGDQLGGCILSVRYEVTIYWPGGLGTEFKMSIIRDNDMEYVHEGKTGNVTFLVKNPGNYSIQWESTLQSSDWKHFDYWVDIYNTSELDDVTLDVIPHLNPVEIPLGTEGTVGLKIININEWPIRIDSVDLSMNLLSGNFSLDTNDEIINTGSSSMFNFTVPISSIESLGNRTMDVNVDFSMNVYGTWYQGLSFEQEGLLGPTIVMKDTDGDHFPDDADHFPNDPSESKDSDGDGVGNNADKFPMNPDETHDTDGDGVGDNSDSFSNDSNESSDLDGDGVGDNGDAFPKDVSASKDTDNDGYPDEWNSGKSEADSTTGLELDKYPSDGEKWIDTEETPFISVIFIIAAVSILCIITYNNRRRD